MGQYNIHLFGLHTTHCLQKAQLVLSVSVQKQNNDLEAYVPNCSPVVISNCYLRE